MNISTVEVRVPDAEDVTVTEDTLTAELSDGRTISVPLAWYPRLVHATEEERGNWRLIGGGHGIHWPDLDEDVSVEGLLAGRPSNESQKSLQRWLEAKQAGRGVTLDEPAGWRRRRATGQLMTGKMQAPDGWQVVRLGDVCAPPEYGAAAASIPYAASLPRYVRITDITDDGRLRVEDKRSADPRQVEGYHLEDGDLLFARSGSVGRTYLYQSQDGPCVFAGYLIRFCPLPDQAIPEYLEHWTHSDSYYRWIASVARRGAQTNINAAEYSSLPILLPPLPEQQAIAAVLDAIDDAIERTKAVITATERLRDALLHELLTCGVPGWHTEWKDVPGIGTIPADWEVVRLGEIYEVQLGKMLSPKARQGKNPRPYLTNRNVRWGKFDLSDLPTMDFDRREIEKFQLRPGDLLVCEGGDTGRAAVWLGEIADCYYQKALHRLRPIDENAISEFMLAVLMSYATKGYSP